MSNQIRNLVHDAKSDFINFAKDIYKIFTILPNSPLAQRFKDIGFDFSRINIHDFNNNYERYTRLVELYEIAEMENRSQNEIERYKNRAMDFARNNLGVINSNLTFDDIENFFNLTNPENIYTLVRNGYIGLTVDEARRVFEQPGTHTVILKNGKKFTCDSVAQFIRFLRAWEKRRQEIIATSYDYYAGGIEDIDENVIEEIPRITYDDEDEYSYTPEDDDSIPPQTNINISRSNFLNRFRDHSTIKLFERLQLLTPIKKAKLKAILDTFELDFLPPVTASNKHCVIKAFLRILCSDITNDKKLKNYINNKFIRQERIQQKIKEYCELVNIKIPENEIININFIKNLSEIVGDCDVNLHYYQFLCYYFNVNCCVLSVSGIVVKYYNVCKTDKFIYLFKIGQSIFSLDKKSSDEFSFENYVPELDDQKFTVTKLDYTDFVSDLKGFKKDRKKFNNVISYTNKQIKETVNYPNVIDKNTFDLLDKKIELNDLIEFNGKNLYCKSKNYSIKYPSNRTLVFYDIETIYNKSDSITKSFSIAWCFQSEEGLKNGEKPISFFTIGNCKRNIKTFCNFLNKIKTSETICIGHNSSNFDLKVMIKHIFSTPEIDYTTTSRLTNGNQLISLKYQLIDGRKYIWRDSYKFFGSSLNDLSKAFLPKDKSKTCLEKEFIEYNVDYTKQIIHIYDLWNGKECKEDCKICKTITKSKCEEILKDIADLEKYNILDVTSLYNIYIEASKTFGQILNINFIPIYLFNTVSAFAKYCLTKISPELFEEQGSLNTSKISTYKSIAQKSYRGGIVAAMFQGIKKIQKGSLFYVDFSSLYPFAYNYPICCDLIKKVSFDLPKEINLKSKIGELKFEDYFMNKKIGGFAKVKFDNNIEKFKNVSYITLKTQEGLKQVISNFEQTAFLSFDEIIFNMRLGVKFLFLEYELYEKKYLFKDFISKIYGLKQYGSNNNQKALKVCTKLIANSSYGYYGQRCNSKKFSVIPYNETEKYKCEEWNKLGLCDYYEKERYFNGKVRKCIFKTELNFSPSNWANFAICADITCRARLYLFQLIENLKKCDYVKQITYCDTDSCMAILKDKFDHSKLKNVFNIFGQDLYDPEIEKSCNIEDYTIDNRLTGFLGGLTEESNNNSGVAKIIIICPKIYMLLDENDKIIKVKSKGIPLKSKGDYYPSYQKLNLSNISIDGDQKKYHILERTEKDQPMLSKDDLVIIYKMLVEEKATFVFHFNSFQTKICECYEVLQQMHLFRELNEGAKYIKCDYVQIEDKWNQSVIRKM